MQLEGELAAKNEKLSVAEARKMEAEILITAKEQERADLKHQATRRKTNRRWWLFPIIGADE